MIPFASKTRSSVMSDSIPHAAGGLLALIFSVFFGVSRERESEGGEGWIKLCEYVLGVTVVPVIGFNSIRDGSMQYKRRSVAENTINDPELTAGDIWQLDRFWRASQLMMQQPPPGNISRDYNPTPAALY